MNINELEPSAVFRIFGSLCAVPRGSGNTDKASGFCVEYAKRLGLRHLRDEAGNVIIYKDGTAGYENSAPVILQGHLDMVCEKAEDCGRDMLREGVVPLTDGEFVFADGTTLGGDNGIAVAYILALLEADNIPHPPIEALFTVDEETGMTGAKALDPSALRGRLLINIDSEEEGILTCGCAGGVRAEITVPVKSSAPQKTAFARLSVSGLRGGHSGMEIDKHRVNGIKLLGRLLYLINREYPVNICSLSGGGKDNVIPGRAEAVIACDGASAEDIAKLAESIFKRLREEKAEFEPDISFSCAETEAAPSCADRESSERIIFTLMHAPDGIRRMSPHIAGAVRTSLNLGAACLDNDCLKMTFLVRSSAEADKRELCEELSSLAEYNGGSIRFRADYPAWEFREDSPLRELMIRVHKELYGREPEVQSIHAGLECGILSAKLRGSDMVSMGPDIENAHTPAERMNVASVKRCYEYLIKVLAALK